MQSIVGTPLILVVEGKEEKKKTAGNNNNSHKRYTLVVYPKMGYPNQTRVVNYVKPPIVCIASR
jgi:hypothetical protein